MRNQRDVDYETNLRIRKFLERDDAQDYMRNFLLKKQIEKENCQEDYSYNESDNYESNNELQLDDKLSPSLKMTITYGTEFGIFIKQTENTIKLDVDFFSTRSTYSYIPASPKMNFQIELNHVFKDKNEIHGEDDLTSLIMNELISNLEPIRFCISTDFPQNQLIGLATFDWRLIFGHSNGLLRTKIDLKGVCNDVVGSLQIALLLEGFDIDLEQFQEPFKLQTRQEKLDCIEVEREFAFSLRAWWLDLIRVVDKRDIEITSAEIGSGPNILFNQIIPFSIRGLDTPGMCLRYCHLLTDLIAPPGFSFIPIWATIASRSGRHREKLNVLVSLLRGLGLNAYVVMAKPRPIAICIYKDQKNSNNQVIYFDVVTGKFGIEMPKILNKITYIYNDKIMLANLHPATLTVDWDIKSPLKWKALLPPKWEYSIHLMPLCLSAKLNPSNNFNLAIFNGTIDEKCLEYMVKKVIEEQRASICNYKTKWSYEISEVIYPIVSIYEKQKQIGTRLENDYNASIKKVLKPYNSLRVVPALTNTSDPIAIFRALMNAKSGLEILAVNKNDARFALRIHVTHYSEGVTAVWSIFAVETLS